MSKVAIAALSDVAQIIMGQSPDGEHYNQDGEGLPLVTGAGQFGEVTPRPTQFSRAGGKQSQPGDILLAIRASIGDLNWSDRAYFLGRGVCAIRPSSKLDARYLWRVLEASRERLNARATGSTFKQIRSEDIVTLPVPLLPMEEQRRIAAMFDEAEALREKRRKSLVLFQSLVTSAFVNLFGPMTSDCGRWPTKPMGDLVRETKLGLVRSASQQGRYHRYKYIRMNSISPSGDLDLSEVSTTDATADEVREASLEYGDFLFNTRNSRELVGKTALFLVKDDTEKYLFNNNIMRIRFKSDVVPEYIATAFQRPFIKLAVDARKAGTTSVFAIYWSALKTVNIPVPPKALQLEFASLYREIDRLKSIQRAALQKLDDLFASLRYHAFSGRI